MTAAIRLSMRLAACLLLTLASTGFAQSEPQVSAPIINSLVTDYLTEHGFTPPADTNLRMSDFVTIASMEDPPRVSISIDKNGMFTPNASWRQYNSEYCMHYAREILEPKLTLSIRAYKVVETADGLARSQYFMFGSLINAETGHIQYQQEANSTTLEDDARHIGNHPDLAGLEDGIYDLLDYLLPNANVAGMADPCGDILVTHVDGNQVGEPAFFLAGYEGGFGTHLTYTWDFGDGTGPKELSKTPEHTYHENGTYTVTATVSGDNVETRTGTTEATIGGEYELAFTTKLTGTFPEGLTLNTTITGTVPLAVNEDGDLVGNGTLHTTDFSGSTIPMIAQLGCTATLMDGPMDVRVENIADPSETALYIAFLFGADGFEGLPGADITCTGPSAAMAQGVMGYLGKTWWPAFIGVHNPELTNDAELRFTAFAAGSSGTVSELQLSGSIIEEGAQLRSDTHFEIRRAE